MRCRGRIKNSPWQIRLGDINGIQPSFKLLAPWRGIPPAIPLPSANPCPNRATICLILLTAKCPSHASCLRCSSHLPCKLLRGILCRPSAFIRAKNRAFGYRKGSRIPPKQGNHCFHSGADNNHAQQELPDQGPLPRHVRNPA